MEVPPSPRHASSSHRQLELESFDRTVVWSEEHCRIFGYDPAKENGLTFQLFLERVHPKDQPFLQQTLEAADDARLAITRLAGYAAADV
jgi:PAS domain-containing protein